MLGWRTLLGIALCAGAASGQYCEASTRAGYMCQHEVDDVLTVHWVTSADNTTVKFAAVSTAKGYTSLGFGTGMQGADILVAQPQNLSLVGKYNSPPSFIPQDWAWLLNSSAMMDGDKLVLEFERTTDVIGTRKVSMVASYHLTDTRGQHSKAAVFVVDLSAVPTPVPACTRSKRHGYACQHKIDDVLTVHWATSADMMTVKFAAVSTAKGYTAFGFGTGMQGADVLIALPGNPDIGKYNLTNPPNVTFTPQNWTWLLDSSVMMEGEALVLEFERSTALLGEEVPMVSAYHLTAPRGPHSSARKFEVNLASQPPPLPTCMRSTRSGFVCEKAIIDSVLTLHWATAEDWKSVDFAVVSSAGGYVSVGFGTEMVGAEVFLVSRGNPLVTFNITSKSPPGFGQQDLEWLSKSSVSEEGGNLVVEFTTGMEEIGVHDVSMVAAYHVSNPQGKHTGATVFSPELLSVPSTVAPTATPVPTIQTPVPTAPGCTTSTLQGYTCQKELIPSVVTLHWALSGDKNTVKYAVASTAAGYTSIGFGTEMVDAEIVSAAPTSTSVSNSNGAVQQHLVKSKNPPVFETTTWTWLVGTPTYKVENNVAVMEFERSTDGIGSGDVSMVVAYHKSDVDPTASFHTGKDVFMADLSATPGDVTPQPAPVTPVPTPAPTGANCPPSSLGLQCSSVFLGKLTLHWTRKESGETAYAVETTHDGWFSVTFAERRGKMGPAAGYIVEDKDKLSAVQVSTGYNVGALDKTEAKDATLEIENGVSIVRWTAESNEVVDMNFAVGNIPAATSAHTDRASAVINLATGGADVDESSKKDEAVVHGIVMTIMWAYLLPLAVLVKRFGPQCCSIKISKYPLPFVVHATLAFIVIVTTVVMVAVALNTFNGNTRYSHKEIGIVVMSLSLVQLVMQVVKCDGGDPKRVYFRFAHVGLGVCTIVLAFAQMIIGFSNLENLYDADTAKPFKILVYVGMGIFILASIIGAVVVHFVKPKEDNKVDGKSTEPAQL